MLLKIIVNIKIIKTNVIENKTNADYITVKIIVLCIYHVLLFTCLFFTLMNARNVD